jgi:hypothetical protein
MDTERFCYSNTYNIYVLHSEIVRCDELRVTHRRILTALFLISVVSGQWLERDLILNRLLGVMLYF